MAIDRGGVETDYDDYKIEQIKDNIDARPELLGRYGARLWRH